jgi:hypothetical protein
MIEKFSEPKKVGSYVLLNVILMYFSLWHKNIIDVCFDNLIKFFCFTLLLYNTKTYDINLLVFSQKCLK